MSFRFSLRSLALFATPIGLILALQFTIWAQDEPPVDQAPLKVAVRDVPPFATKGENGDWKGISVELWDEVAYKLGRTYEWVEMPLVETIEAVDEGKVDAAVAALTITSEREKRFDFSHPYMISGLSVAYMDSGRSAWAATMRGFFSWDFFKTIFSLALLLLAVGGAVWYFERKGNHSQFDKEARKGLGDGFWWSAVTMTTVGYGDKAPSSLGGRIVALCWMFASLILIATFTASITASLTANRMESEILKNKSISELYVGVLDGSAAEEGAKERGAFLRAFNTVQDGLDAVAAGRVDVFLHDRPILRHEVGKRDDGLEVATRIIVRDDYGFAFPAGSALRDPVNSAMLEFLHEPGWEKIRMRWLGEDTVR